VRGKQNVQKRLLLQAAACNLALLLRRMIVAGALSGVSGCRRASAFNLVSTYPGFSLHEELQLLVEAG
jgi:hypothetical protein